ncbi:uncharacterized protein LOC106177538 isoform X2 [Lingula anatina]|uniref:Uncharacterized protein LOC106177538 isoform X2 n=1 Tax=Lingula anatina TaxID=7574 RepID=A0A1S3JZI6_LINAN|nr:uncharacterized protein LOC106177538 isoform X2 [Lingula anatina]|eukprot:XP_013415805.1 uncharacterized protein LOC106177538 isoform X2 [Lingula anatina]
MSRISCCGLLIAFLALFLLTKESQALRRKPHLGSAQCRGPCDSSVALRMRDDSLQEIPFLKPQGNFCPCWRGCPTPGEPKAQHRQLSWYVKLDNDQKFVAQNSYCSLKKGRRECKGDETAVEVEGASLFAGGVLAVHCHCQDPDQILLQKYVARKGDSMYQGLTCAQSSCHRAPASECARVYTKADDTLTVQYMCSCPTGTFCPMHLYDHLSTPRTDEKGLEYMPAFCARRERDSNETS